VAPDRRYAQFCPSARALEILGERWTLLIVRELLCGPQRFSDLRRRLPDIGASILSERLARLEERGLVAREEAPPPAPATLYTLTPLGQQLRAVMLEMIRFGVRFTEPPRAGDHLEPEWLRLGLEAFARHTPTPKRRFLVRIPDAPRDVELLVAGGRRGTLVEAVGGGGAGAVDATLRAAPMALLALASGQLRADAALAAGRIEVGGDASSLADFAALFDLGALLARPNPRTG
jgi:DNA-binding HxlR family transcriptional regulator